MARPPAPVASGPTLVELAEGTGAPPPRRPGRKRRPPSRWLRRLVALLLLGLILGAAGLGVVAWYLDDLGRTPREWAPYLRRRAAGNNGVVVAVGGRVAGMLEEMDRLAWRGEPAIPPGIGASPARSGNPPAGGARLAQTPAQLAAMLEQATPGQVIQLVPGPWRIDGRGLRIVRPGTAAAPIVLRAERLGDVTLVATALEAIKLSAPYWTIENLIVRGACDDHSACEHAVHVVGGAVGTVIRNNRFEDFNAQIKVNGEDGAFPDNGRIEGNTLVNTVARDTKAPITPIDMVAASNWRIAGNFIADFQRAFTGNATYGGFAKGAGEGNVFERNVVLCEWKLRPSRSPNVGLSIGGGGSFPVEVMRDLGKSGAEQIGGAVRDNLIAFCNDVGIYVNKGRRSLLAHNTLLDTAGIGVRFAESSAEVVGNLIDGVIQARDGAAVRTRDNAAAMLLGLFVGLHPARDLFRDPARLDLRWRSRPEALASGEIRADLCGAERSGRVMPGAFEDFARCR